MTTFEEHIQRSTLGPQVELIDLDLTPRGGSVIRLVPTPFHVDTSEDDVVTWKGNIYTPRPFQTDGWEWNGQGSPPTPKFRTANIDLAFFGYTIDYEDMLGCIITRWRTFKNFLDGEDDADEDAHFPPDIYRIDRKSQQNNLLVEFELASAFDQANVLLPRRAVVKNACPWRYRIWDPVAEEFVYTNAICPYTGSNMYTFNGVATSDPLLDNCGKRLSDCKLRYGDAVLPFGGFPAVDSIRR